MAATRSVSGSSSSRRLASLDVGAEGVVVDVLDERAGRAGRLMALGVTPGARIRVLQRFPGFAFECDQTELAVEPAVAREILVGEVTAGARRDNLRGGLRWPTTW